MTKSSSVFIFVFLVFFSNDLRAIENCDYGNYEENFCSEEECYENNSLLLLQDGMNLYSFYSFGKSPGICENYGSTGLFYAPCLCPCDYGFIFDGAIHYFDNSTLGASGGIGYRFVNSDDTFVGGLSAFYDYREGKVGKFHQLSVNLEIIGDCFEFSANGYFPICNKVKTGKTIFFNDYDNTGVSNPYEASAFKREFSLTGFDAEGGVRYCCKSFTAYAGVGPYYFDRSSFVDFWGVKGRARVEYGRILAIEGQVTWDDLNKRQGRVQIEINIPFFLFCDICDALCCPCKSQRRIHRDFPIHLDSCCSYTTNF